MDDDEDQRSEYSEDFEDEVAQYNESSAHETMGRDQTKAQNHILQRKGTERSGDRGSKGKIAGKKRMSSNLRLSPYKHSTSLIGSSPKDRVISARVHEISALQNELAEKKTSLESLRKENKILLRLQARQEKELSKLQHQEGELPQILAHHAEEVRVLREQLRRSQEAAHAAEKKLAEVREELYRTSGRTKELEEAAKKKDLMERVSLTLQLQQANDTISSKDRKIAELGRNCEILARNHAQEVRVLVSKNRSLTQEAEELKESIQKARHHLKEREKELDVLNIYSQRINCSMPKGLSTQFHTPLMEGAGMQTELSFPPNGPVSFHATVTFVTATTQTEIPVSFFQPLSPPVPPESNWKPSNSPPPDVIKSSKSACVDKIPNAVGNVGELHKESLSNVTSQVSSGARAVNSFDGSHVENATMKLVGEKNGITSNGTSVAKLHSNPSEEEERQKKEILLAKLRALSNGPPASVPLSMSVLTRNAAEPSVPIGGSIQHEIRSVPASDNQMVPSAPSADVKGTPTLCMDTKQVPPTIPSTSAESQQEAGGTPSKPNMSAGNVDSKQLLLTKLMAIDKANGKESSGSSKLIRPLASEARADPAVSKQLLLAKLMAIDTGKETEPLKRSSISGIPDMLKNEQQPDSTHTDGPSSQSKLENMHRGKPAFATDDDPFGFRVISAEKKKQKELKQSAKGGTFMTENESELPSETKPRFGRRVQVPLQGGNSSASTLEQSLLPPAQVPPQSYQPSFMGIKDTPAPTISALGGPQACALDGDNQVGSFTPEGDKESKEDTWLKKASTHTTTASTLSHNGGGNQRPAKPLLPLRPKATENTFDIMPGAIQGDDDVEEITL